MKSASLAWLALAFSLVSAPRSGAQVPTNVEPPPATPGQVIQLNTIQAASDRGAQVQTRRGPGGKETAASVQQRFDLAKEALASVAGIISNVNRILGFTAMEQALGAGTNPWSDEDFRNGCDKLDGWATPIGLVPAGASAFLPTQQGRVNTSAAFLGLSGISRRLGARFGQQTGAKFESKAAFVEFSRRAYDDLRDRYSSTNEYIQSNKALLADSTRTGPVTSLRPRKARMKTSGRLSSLPARSSRDWIWS